MIGRNAARRAGATRGVARRAGAFLAAVSFVLRAASSRAEADGRLGDWARSAVIERRVLSDGTRVLLNPDPTVSSVAVCVEKDGEVPAHPQIDLGLERRGGEGSVRDSIFCAAIAGGAVRYAMSAAAEVWKQRWVTRETGDDGASPRGPLDRIREIALEGTEKTAPVAPACITIAGNVALSAALALVEDLFGKTREAPSPGAHSWAIHQTSERLSVLANGASTPQIHAGWALPDSGADGEAAQSIAFDIWIGGPGSRLQSALGGLRGLTREVHGFSIDILGGRISGVSAELSSRSSVDRVFRFVDGSLRRLRLAVPTRAEVRRARARLALRILEDWDNPVARARRLSRKELTRGDARRVLAEYEGLWNVTPAAVREVAAAHLLETRRTTVEAYPKLWPPDDPRLQRYRLYTAEDGDTLESIATRFGASITALCRANDLEPKRKLAAGQGIWVPPGPVR